jgi:hypothetical protein
MEKLHSLNILKSSCTNVTVIVLEMYSYKVLFQKKKKKVWKSKFEYKYFEIQLYYVTVIVPEIYSYKVLFQKKIKNRCENLQGY